MKYFDQGYTFLNAENSHMVRSNQVFVCMCINLHGTKIRWVGGLEQY